MQYTDDTREGCIQMTPERGAAREGCGIQMTPERGAAREGCGIQMAPERGAVYR